MQEGVGDYQSQPSHLWFHYYGESVLCTGGQEGKLGFKYCWTSSEREAPRASRVWGPNLRGFSQVSLGPVVSLGGGSCLPASPGWGENDIKMKASGQCEKPPYLCIAVVIVKSLSRVWLFCNPMDCSPPGSSVHGILQGRILKQVAISFPRGSSPPRARTRVSCIGRQILYRWATREAPLCIF